jgi:hypothetical protein
MRFKDVLLTIFAMLIASPAFAQWSVKSEGPDVFGSTSAFAEAGSTNGPNMLVIQCDDNENLTIALLSPATDAQLNNLSANNTDLTAKVLVRVDQGSVTTFDGHLRGWNKNYMAFVVSGRSPESISLIRTIGTAHSHIDAGVEVNGRRHSDSFTAGGSKAAMASVIKTCKLGAE